MITIEQLAAEVGLEVPEALTALGLDDEVSPDVAIESLEGWTETEAREVLTGRAGQARRG